MKGFYTGSAYWGWVPTLQRYMQFPTDEEYFQYLQEDAA